MILTNFQCYAVLYYSKYYNKNCLRLHKAQLLKKNNVFICIIYKKKIITLYVITLYIVLHRNSH